MQIIETIRFILFRDELFTRGQSTMRRFIYERSATNIRDWSLLAYSYTCSSVDMFVFNVNAIGDNRARQKGPPMREPHSEGGTDLKGVSE